MMDGVLVPSVREIIAFKFYGWEDMSARLLIERDLFLRGLMVLHL